MPQRGKKSVLVRQWQLVTLLGGAHFGWERAALATRLKVSGSTLDRDLETIERFGVTVERFRVNGQLKLRLESHNSTAAAPSVMQMAALRIIRAAARELCDTTAFDQLDTLLDEFSARRSSEAPESGAPPSSGGAALLSVVDRAIAARRRLALDYLGSSGRRSRHRDVEPVALHSEGERVLLLAFDIGCGDYRLFNVARIASAEVLPFEAADHSQAVLPPTLARLVRDSASEAPAAVVIRLDADSAATLVDHPLQGDQVLEPLGDGSLLVRARVDRLGRALRWVLSWGSGAEALSPAGLREAVRAELDEAARTYKPAPRGTAPLADTPSRATGST